MSLVYLLGVMNFHYSPCISFVHEEGKYDVYVKLHESAIMSHTTSLHFIHLCSLLPLNSMWQRSDFYM